MGNGLSSMALIGPRSVRLYPNRREDGFGQGLDVPRKPDSDSLPLFSHSRSELVMLGNLLGGDMSELCRIRHDEIKCWPNLGHGRFGKDFVMSALPFDYATFDSARVRIADLDGYGAPALIYLKSDCFEIYLNHGGNGLEQIPVTVPWPDNIRYDNLCQVTLADLQGLGCASLILTVPHMSPRHWRYDFVSANTLEYVDTNGEAKADEVINNYSKFIAVLEGHAAQTLEQLDNVFNQTNIALDLLKNLAGESINAAIGFPGGLYGAQAGGVLLPDAPHVVNLTTQGKPAFSEGLTGGNLGGELAGAAGGASLPMASLIRPLIPQTSTMSIEAIDRQLGLSADDSSDWLGKGISIFLNNVVGSIVPGVGAFLNMGSQGPGGRRHAKQTGSGQDHQNRANAERVGDHRQ